MKYRANEAVNLSEEQKKDAKIALAKYEAITNKEDRARFLENWQVSMGKGENSFKFANKFSKGLRHDDTVSVGDTEYMLTRISFYMNHLLRGQLLKVGADPPSPSSQPNIPPHVRYILQAKDTRDERYVPSRLPQSR